MLKNIKQRVKEKVAKPIFIYKHTYISPAYLSLMKSMAECNLSLASADIPTRFIA